MQMNIFTTAINVRCIGSLEIQIEILLQYKKVGVLPINMRSITGMFRAKAFRQRGPE